PTPLFRSLHVLFAALWVGGLAVLALSARRLGAEVAQAAARYSQLALWCFIGVGVSGIANAWIRLGSLAGFGTAYGVLLLVKIVCFLALGTFSYLHRERTIPALAPTDGTGTPRAFWRLVGVEVVVMAAVMGVA